MTTTLPTNVDKALMNLLYVRLSEHVGKEAGHRGCTSTRRPRGHDQLLAGSREITECRSSEKLRDSYHGNQAEIKKLSCTLCVQSVEDTFHRLREEKFVRFTENTGSCNSVTHDKSIVFALPKQVRS